MIDSASSSAVCDFMSQHPTSATPTVVARDVHVCYRVRTQDPRRSPRFHRITVPRRRLEYVHAVKGVSFEAYAGESIGFVGRNGSGKSSLLHVVGGLRRPQGGLVYASATPCLLGIGAALQRDLSGRRNIRLGCLALGMRRKEVEGHVEDIVEFAGLHNSIDRPLRTYSSGMAARLHFAIATSVTPRILLIDESLSVGDEEFQARSKERIDGLLRAAGTVFIVSHSLPGIRSLCSRAFLIDDGRIVLDSDPATVTKTYVTSYRDA